MIDDPRPSSPSFLRRESGFTLASLAVTIIATALLAADLVAMQDGAAALAVVEHALFGAIVVGLVYGNLVYQLARWGWLRRRARHAEPNGEAFDPLFRDDAPAVTILVPSYREEPAVIRQTLLSAAFQSYPNRRIVLLIDDPPDPAAASDEALLGAARRLPGAVAALLRGGAETIERSVAAVEAAGRGAGAEPPAAALAGIWRAVAAWFDRQADAEPAVTHGDRLFVEKTLRRCAQLHRERAAALLARAEQGRALTAAEVRAECRRLRTVFRAEITAFERKRYVNLSHEPNKAMNLNSYMALLGGTFREDRQPDGVWLRPAAPPGATLAVPDTDYVLTLDADSLLLPDYALRLVHLMERPGNERIAVAQTPYSAIPGAPGVLERVAGATTDIQLLVHQGFTRYGATYWVGANALLRRAAMDEIREVAVERGHTVVRYIQDRTVIEDTESSVDLIERGWTLHNHPERLAYSATPPDFGALLIQRRRWSNGGLIILPKLLRHLVRRPSRATCAEAFMRIHYLASPAWSSTGLLLLMLYPFAAVEESVWLPLVTVPYFALYARDLVLNGYRPLDLLRVYALNLMLVPITIGGVAKSLHQGWSGRKIPFGRTPKTAERTTVPRLYLLAEAGLLLICGTAFVADVIDRRWVHAAFSAVNGAFFAYGLCVLIGLRAWAEDFRGGAPNRARRRRARPAAPRLARQPS